MNSVENSGLGFSNCSANNIVDKIDDIDEMSAFDILEKIRILETDDIKYVLEDERIKGKLRYGLLFESRDNQWYYYRRILMVITPSQFLSLYDSNYLTQYFLSTTQREEKYRFYAALCECDVNDTVRYVLKDKELYEDFFMQSEGFYSSFEDLNYDLFKEVIFKMQRAGFKLSSHFLSSIRVEHQYDILNEPFINNDTLVFLLPHFNNSVKSYFFENDKRALYLYTKFDINTFLKKGVKFSNAILKDKYFFELMKSDSFIEFRSNVNSAEKNNNPIFIEEKLGKYYDEIISHYDEKNGLFYDYNFILDNPGYAFDMSYIISKDVLDKVYCHLKEGNVGNFYYEDKDKLMQFLMGETNKKLSEVIVDALFGDNIYNVWINIKEMLRYNSLLNDEDKIIDEDKYALYMMILNFDKIDNGIKIELYNKFKNKNFSLTFYSDLRKIKDAAYGRIKDTLINPSLHPEYIDKASSDKLGVCVYDLRDKDYTMLVRMQDDFREVDHYRRGCYSIISNENTRVFCDNSFSSFLYGYNSFDSDRVLHMFESDSYSSNFKDEPSKFVNRIMTSEQLVKASSCYSEVQLINIKSNERRCRWYAKRPDFIVTFNTITNRHIVEAKRLGIPIVVILRRELDNDDTIDVNFDNDIVVYVKDVVGEREHKIRR